MIILNLEGSRSLSRFFKMIVCSGSLFRVTALSRQDLGGVCYVCTRSATIGLKLSQCNKRGEAKVSEAKRKRNVRGMNANRLHHRPYARGARKSDGCK